MRYVAMIPFKGLFREYCAQLEKQGIKYIESKEFKKSEYDHYSSYDLLEAINNEDSEERRAVLTCLLHYKIEHKFFTKSDLMSIDLSKIAVESA